MSLKVPAPAALRVETRHEISRPAAQRESDAFSSCKSALVAKCA